MRFSRSSRLTLGVLALCVTLFLNCAARADETVVAPSATAPEKIVLRLCSTKGQIYDEVVVIQQKTSQNLEGRRIETETNMRFGKSTEVLDITEEGATRLKITYQTLKFQIRGTGKRTVDYDSTQDQAVPNEALSDAALLGESLTLTVSPQGKVLRVEGLEAIAERTFELTKVPESSRSDDMRKSMQEAVRNRTQSAYVALPDHAIGIGEVWQDKTESSEISPTTDFATYQLLSRKDGAVRISNAVKMAPRTQNIGFLPVRVSLSGASNGVLTLDEETGWTKEFETNGRISGKISITTQQKIQSWPIYIKTTVRGWTAAPIQK